LTLRTRLNGRRQIDWRKKSRNAGDTGPKDMDDFRNRLTRSIYVLFNAWRGCPEPICWRHRGCMAPNIVGGNVPPPP